MKILIDKEVLQQALAAIGEDRPVHAFKILRTALDVAEKVEPDGRCNYCMAFNGHQDGCVNGIHPAPTNTDEK